MKTKLKMALSLILSAIVIFSSMAIGGMFANADTNTGKAIQLVKDGAAANITGGQASNIYFGTYKQSSDGNNGYNTDPIKWRVLENNTESKQLFLLSDQGLDTVQYHTEYEDAKWEKSTIRSWLNGYDANSNTGGDNGISYTGNNFIDTAFSNKEQATIADTNVGNKTNDKIFLLSLDEAENSSYFSSNTARKCVPTDYAINKSAYTDYGACWWWLGSSRYYCTGYAPYIDCGGGTGAYLQAYVYTNNRCVRPAFNLNLSSVLFTSAAEGGKKSSSDNAISKIGDYTGNEWKVTLKDSSRDFKITNNTPKTRKPGDTIALFYTGATVYNKNSAPNEYISVIITDSTGNAIYYGRVMQPKSKDGKVDIKIPSDIAIGTYTLNVFSEQYNGGANDDTELTDYASEFIAIKLTVDSVTYDYGFLDTFTFGSYPQTEIKNEKFKAVLKDACDKDTSAWVDYNYYAYDDNDCHAAVVPDMMLYKDFEYLGYKYRAVKINQYRPEITTYESSAKYSNQEENGYKIENTYYFKFEPIEWLILDLRTGYVMCNSVIDSQAFQNLVYTKGSDGSECYNSTDYRNYASDWATSFIREWLNEDFYKTAFTTDEQAKISTTELTNNAVEDDTYSGPNTSDKIFLMSYGDVTNSNYGFNAETDLSLKGSDYAKCQGLITTREGYNLWRLRSAFNSYSNNRVASGYIDQVNYTSGGVVPAFSFDFRSIISESKETITPIHILDENNYWTESNDGGLTFTSLGIKGSGTGKAIQLVKDGADTNISGGQISNIYFGNYAQSDTTGSTKDPIKWRVLANNTSSKQLFLLSDQALDTVQYHTQDEGVSWEKSTIRSWLNGYGSSCNNGGDNGISYTGNNFIDTAFSNKEQAAIVDTNVEYEINDKIFLLSTDEANNSSYFSSDGARRCIPTDYATNKGAATSSNYTVDGKATCWWWLRSPGGLSYDAAGVNYVGGVYYYGDGVDTAVACVRPAFNLNLQSVLFTSAAVGGKKSSATGTISKIADDYIENDWKVTLKDTNRKFDITDKTPQIVKAGETITLSYTGATIYNKDSAPNEYISVIIRDGNGNAIYYGRVAQPTTTDGQVDITIPSDLPNGEYGEYALYVFSEQYNGGANDDTKLTDYASEFSTIKLTVCDHTRNTNKATCTEPCLCSVCGIELSPATGHTLDSSGKCTVCNLIEIAIPTANKDLIYNGEVQTGVNAGTGYTLVYGNTGESAGTIIAKAILWDGYMWSDGTTEPKKISWSIAKKEITPTVNIEKVSYTYTGEEIKPTVTVSYEGKVINADDYDVTYSNNIEPGNAIVTVNDVYEISNYEYKVTNIFTITKADPTKPSNLEGVYGLALSTVALPEGWSWVDGTVVMNTMGNQEYSAKYTPTDTQHYNEITVSLPVTVKEHEHKWSSEWSHDETYHWHECTAPGCTITDNANKDGYAAHNGGKATCTEDGFCADCKVKYLDATGHAYANPVFVWADDNTAKVTFTCSNDKTHTLTKDCNITSKTTKTPTCTEEGEITYTASYTLDGNTYTGEKEVPVGATGHAYANPSFTWTDDNTATVTFTCSNDETHKLTEDCDITSEITKKATCTEKGEITYTASYTLDNKEYKDEIKVPTDANGHAYANPVFNWSDDNTAKVTFTCSNDKTHTLTKDCNITSETTKKATCTEKGEITYTASYTLDNKEYKDEKKVPTDATGHSFDANGKCTKAECGYVCDHADNTNKATCEKSAVCSKCGATLSSTGHDFSKLIKTNKATFFKDGSKVYHCTHDGCTETRTEITLSTINRILAWFRNIFSFKF